MGTSFIVDTSSTDKSAINERVDRSLVRLMARHRPSSALIEHDFAKETPALLLDRLVKDNTEVLVATSSVIQHCLALGNDRVFIIVLIGECSDDVRAQVDVVINPLSTNQREYFSGLRYFPREALDDVELDDLSMFLGLEKSDVLTEVDQNGAIHALNEIASLYRILDWDTGFFGFPVAFVTTRRLTRNIERFINEKALKHNIRFLEYCCNCHDPVSVSTAEDNGYRFVDIRVTLENDLTVPPESENIQYPSTSSDLEVVRATEGDIDYLVPTTKQLYLDSRYFFDGHFPKEKLHQFYADWLKKSVLGDFDDCVFLIRDRKQKKLPFGFCSFRKKAFADQVAVIGLFGIDPVAQGQGHARALLNGVFHEMRSRGFSKVEVVTQGRNLPAQRIYQKTGFVTQMMELWYHKWFY